MSTPYFQSKSTVLFNTNATELSALADDCIDLLCTDPPYGMSFMGKEWDKALPDQAIWAECYRVLKPGAFAFVMSIPRADCLSRMIISLEEVGFLVNFTPIFWAYASGFPKAKNIGKAVDKKLGAERGRVEKGDGHNSTSISKSGYGQPGWAKQVDEPITSQAKALDGSFAGFQPKPAVEVIIVAMKPLDEGTYIAQAMKDGKGVTWLGNCMMPYDQEPVAKRDLVKQKSYTGGQVMGSEGDEWEGNIKGRFPANLLVSDDVLNDGQDRKSPSGKVTRQPRKAQVFTDKNCGFKSENLTDSGYGDSGSFSRYFDLDKWWAKTFPFLIVPKASKSEKNKGLGGLPKKQKIFNGQSAESSKDIKDVEARFTTQPVANNHPTVKPLKLMSYLITLGSRAGDIVLDPFLGSGTTCLAAQMLQRRSIGYELSEESCQIAKARIEGGK